jgi:hypothetical protein
MATTTPNDMSFVVVDALGRNDCFRMFVISREHVPVPLQPRTCNVHKIVLKCFDTSVLTNLMRSNFILVHSVNAIHV